MNKEPTKKAVIFETSQSKMRNVLWNGQSAVSCPVNIKLDHVSNLAMKEESNQLSHRTIVMLFK